MELYGRSYITCQRAWRPNPHKGGQLPPGWRKCPNDCNAPQKAPGRKSAQSAKPKRRLGAARAEKKGVEAV
jgi:hypothetical protein